MIRLVPKEGLPVNPADERRALINQQWRELVLQEIQERDRYLNYLKKIDFLKRNL